MDFQSLDPVGLEFRYNLVRHITRIDGRIRHDDGFDASILACCAAEPVIISGQACLQFFFKCILRLFLFRRRHPGRPCLHCCLTHGADGDHRKRHDLADTALVQNRFGLVKSALEADEAVAALGEEAGTLTFVNMKMAVYDIQSNLLFQACPVYIPPYTQIGIGCQGGLKVFILYNHLQRW